MTNILTAGGQRSDPESFLRGLSDTGQGKSRGKLKIFFGYAAGVGKTYAMLEEARALKKAGTDVVIGYVELHQRPATLALLEGLPRIPPLSVLYKSAAFSEFDIDSALKRRPELILVDELAHTNARGCRHEKRYQDVEELLRRGIDVYTTINAQHLEGLHDVVHSITGVAVRERIPDSVFDGADRVELVDIEPDDLVARLGEGKIYGGAQAKRALKHFFAKENLVALREIALRRTADRVNISVTKNKTDQQDDSYVTDEHILMCLSSSPYNAKVIRTAAHMADAFHGSFTALFVETADFTQMLESNKKRLRENIRLAEQLGAKIVTVYGDDVAYQAAEYAKAGGVSKVVIGRPGNKRVFGFNTQNYVDKLATYAPNLEIYVIPSTISDGVATEKEPKGLFHFPSITTTDSLRTLACLAFATALGFLFNRLGFSEANTITVYILASLFTAVITDGKIYGFISSLCAVLLFNFFFTEPFYSLKTHNPEYPITFVIMFSAALTTSIFTKRVKELARQTGLKAYRTEVLLETSQKLQLAKDKNDILLEIIRQVQKLLNRTVFIYPVSGNMLEKPLSDEKTPEETDRYVTTEEYAVAQWVFENNKHAGATTDTLSGAKSLYLSIRSGATVFAVIGIVMENGTKLDVFAKNLLMAMLGECALVLEKETLLEAKNSIALKADREELRSNLLRAISHDLRTPLTGIAGGSNFLLENLDVIEKEELRTMLSDISGDALWLSNLVENLLQMTRIQDGRLIVTKKRELIDEVVSAALTKVLKRAGAKPVNITKSQELIFVPMDAQLIMQVIINLVDNAFKHTRENTQVTISYGLKNDAFELSVSDNGGGIPLNRLDTIFEPFFTLSKQTIDRQRGMGLGLGICRSIALAHGGTLTAANNDRDGATFTITLPLELDR